MSDFMVKLSAFYQASRPGIPSSEVCFRNRNGKALWCHFPEPTQTVFGFYGLLEDSEAKLWDQFPQKGLSSAKTCGQFIPIARFLGSHVA